MEKYLIEIIVISIGIFLGLSAFYYLFKGQFEDAKKTTVTESKDQLLVQVLPLKTQAYERMLLLVDRISPKELVWRNPAEEVSVIIYQQILIKDLQSEFQHNVAQFLYLSPAAVQMMRKLKADTIQLIQTKTLQLGEGASAKDLARELVVYMAALTESPYEYTSDYLQHDFQKDLYK